MPHAAVAVWALVHPPAQGLDSFCGLGTTATCMHLQQAFHLSCFRHSQLYRKPEQPFLDQALRMLYFRKMQLSICSNRHLCIFTWFHLSQHHSLSPTSNLPMFRIQYSCVCVVSGSVISLLRNVMGAGITDCTAWCSELFQGLRIYFILHVCNTVTYNCRKSLAFIAKNSLFQVSSLGLSCLQAHTLRRWSNTNTSRTWWLLSQELCQS